MEYKKKGSSSKGRKGCLIMGAVGCVILLLISFFIGGVIFLFFVLVALAGSETTAGLSEIQYYGSEAGEIAIIDLKGTMTSAESGGGLTGGQTANVTAIIELLDDLDADPNVEAIVIDMNTPGGEAVASSILYDKVKEVNDGGTTVVVRIGDMGASGGYYAAAGAEKIVAHPSSMTGSIGTIMEVMSLSGLYEKVGIQTRTFKSGEYKDMTGLFDADPNGVQDQMFQTIIDETNEDFIKDVAEGRGMDISDVREIADGRILTGRQALKEGLVDDLGDLDRAIEVAKEEEGLGDVSVVWYSPYGFWDSLFLGMSMRLDLNPLGNAAEAFNVRPGARLMYMVDLQTDPGAEQVEAEVE